MHILKRWLGGVLIAMALAACSMDAAEDRKDDEGAAARELQPVTNQPSRLAIGDSVVVGLKDDGTLWSWGVGVSGALGDGTVNMRKLTPAPIAGMTDFVEVSGRASHFLALRRDGTVWSWGSNRRGELGYVTQRDYSAIPTQVPGLQGITSVSAGFFYSLALGDDGRLFAFGDNEAGTLSGDKSVDRYTTPELVKHIPGAIKVVAGISESALITSGGDAHIWGDIGSEYGDVKSDNARHQSGQITISGVREVALGSSFTCLVMRNGDVAAMGSNRAGELGQGDFKKYPGQLVKIGGLPPIKNIAASGHAVIAIDEKGRVWQWGASVKGPPPRTDSASPILTTGFPKGSKAVEVHNNGVRAAFLENGQVYFWGADASGMRGTGKVSEPKAFFFGKRHWTTPEKSLWSFH